MANPSFSEFIGDKIGQKWVVARRTPRTVAKHGDDVVCISQAKYATVRAEYDRLYSPEAAVRAMLDALEHIANCSRNWAKPGADPMLETIEYLATQAATKAKAAGIRAS